MPVHRRVAVKKERVQRHSPSHPARSMHERTLSTVRPLGGWLLAAVLGGLVVGLVAGPVAAGSLGGRSPVGAPLALTADQLPEHLITVSGTGKVTLVPDQATIRLGVLVERKTAKEAREVAAASMSRVIAAIRKLDVAERDIATSLVSLQPVYDYPNNTTPRIRGYQLQNVVTITVRDLTALGSILDDGVVAGATTVDGISFDVADRTAAEARAREAAVRDAKAKAEAIASGLGVRISGVASVSETVQGPIWYNPYAGAVERDAATPILAGTTDVTISIAVAFLID